MAIHMSVSKFLYFSLYALFIVQRLHEMRLTRLNSRRLRLRGGVEMYAAHFKYMILFHVSWFMACGYLGWVTDTFPSIHWMLLGTATLLLCQAIRAMTVQSLGDRWLTRIYIVPNEPIVTSGIYSRVRHPNYLVVVFEIMIFPLMTGSWKTAMLFSLLNGVILLVRIRAEESALDCTGGYREFKANVGCFFPKKFGIPSVLFVTVLSGWAIGLGVNDARASWIKQESRNGVQVELDSEVKFPLPKPNDLPLIRDHQASLEELVIEGSKNWWQKAFLDGEPSALPYDLISLYLSSFSNWMRDGLYSILLRTSKIGLPHESGELLPQGMVKWTDPNGRTLAAQTCAACHSGTVNGHLIPGVNNKWYSLSSMFRFSRNLMQRSLPLLKISGHGKLLQQTQSELERMSRFEKLYLNGCGDLSYGLLPGARTWQISTQIVKDISEVEGDDAGIRHPCGLTKAPGLSTVAFRNLQFIDGAVNSLWAPHFPIFDLLGYKDYSYYMKKMESREIQTLDAFVYWGMKSPEFTEIMGTSVQTDRAQRGFGLFHKQNSCASCHGTYSENGLLKTFRVQVIPLKEIRTEPDRAEGATQPLLASFTRYNWIHVPQIQNKVHKYEVGYRPLPLCSTFLNYPYLHTGGVPTLYDLLRPEAERPLEFWVSDYPDTQKVGFHTTPPDRLVNGEWRRVELRKIQRGQALGHSGERYGTTLTEDERLDLLEYLKTLRCP